MAVDVTGDLFLVVPKKIGGGGGWCGCVGFFLFSIFWVTDNLWWWVAIDDVGHLLLMAPTRLLLLVVEEM